MATKKTAAEECCAKCEKDITALKKEIAAIKKELKTISIGGKDSRVDLLVSWLKNRFDLKNFEVSNKEEQEIIKKLL
jgi:hypothetical protein